MVQLHEAEQSGIRYRVDREGQVVRLTAEQPSSAMLSPRARDVTGGGTFASAALLAIKAKVVDDGLHAAVELAAQRGTAAFRGKHALLEAVLAHLESDGDARATLVAASSLGAGHPCPPGRAAEIQASFLADELRSKPLGFYTWTDELARVFRQDRLLQTDLSRTSDLVALAETLRKGPSTRASYEACLRLPEQLTNALATADLRDVLASLEAGRAVDTGRPIAFFPASRAHETELVKRLYGDRSIRGDSDLSKALVQAIRAGEIDLTPSESSGFYDVQTWSLETLAAPARAIEAKSLELDASYVAHLEDLFRAMLTTTRETHVKQLEVPPAGAAAPRVVKLHVAPQLTVEPLVTHYQRRADAYRFVRALLAVTFGEEALGEIHGLRAGKPALQPLGMELAAMIHLFDGAAATAMRELGIPTTWSTRAFERWRGGQGDPDVDADVRAMVPVFHDVERRKTKVWMMLGWVRASMRASFARPPRVEVLGGAKVEVEPSSSWYPLATPVMVEAYVSRLLDRDEFRALCDRHRTKDAIVAAVA